MIDLAFMSCHENANASWGFYSYEKAGGEALEHTYGHKLLMPPHSLSFVLEFYTVQGISR